jgi:hypothetical protein
VRVTWYVSAENVQLCGGDLYVYWADTNPPTHSFATVRSPKRGFNLVRVDFGPELLPAEREAFMQNLLLIAEIRYNDLIGNKHEQTV